MKFPKCNKILILILTICFAAVVTFLGRNELGTRNFPFSVMVTSDGTKEEIFCMKIGDEFYLFLPSYVQLEQAKICTNPVYDVYIEGQKLTNDRSCADFPTNTQLEFSFHSVGNEGNETITFVRSANVGTMFIDVPSGNMEYIHETKGNAEAASVRLYREDGELNYQGTAQSVKGRGNATWEAEKKSYSVRLQGEADFLEMGQAQNWILLSNAYDTSHLRNKIAYDMAEAVGLAYSPESAWVDLYLNGSYAGLYLLCERNEVHPQRVQIPEESGFLVSLESPGRLEAQGYPHIKTENGLALRIHHSSLSQQELEQIWQSVENAIFAENGIDPITGKSWEEMIDLDSWAHKYLLEELFANVDAGCISQFFYCDTSQSPAKIYAGPIWDLDYSMGKGDGAASNPKSFVANRRHFFSQNDAPLFYGLYQKDAFYNRVVELYASVEEPLFSDLLEEKFWDYEETISQAKKADQFRWYAGDPKEVETIASYLQDRLECYRDLWINQTEYCTVEITSAHLVWGCYLVPKGSSISQIVEGDFGQWYDASTGESFHVDQPILENIYLFQEKS